MSKTKYLFITQSYFRTPKDARLNSTYYILMKISNKKELKSIAEENSGHLDFLKIYNYCTREPYSFMMVDTRPTACVTFKKNFNEPIKGFTCKALMSATFINNDS